MAFADGEDIPQELLTVAAPKLVVVRATNGEVSPEPSAKADAARFVATVERIPK